MNVKTSSIKNLTQLRRILFNTQIYNNIHILVNNHIFNYIILSGNKNTYFILHQLFHFEIHSL